MLPNRDITEEPSFRKELLAIEPDPRAADVLIDEAKWVLSRDPRRGQHLDGYALTWYFTIIRPGRSQLILYYAFDDKEVLLVSIQERI